MIVRSLNLTNLFIRRVYGNFGKIAMLEFFEFCSISKIGRSSFCETTNKIRRILIRARKIQCESPGRLRRGVALVDGPCPYFLDPGREVGLQAEQVVAGMRQSIEAGR